MRNFSVLAIVIAAISLLSSCGSSKKIATPGGTTKATSLMGAELEKPKSQLLAEESPATRAWGEGLNHRQSFARNYAAGQARSQLALAISAIIKTATEEFGADYDKYAGSSEEGQSVRDENGMGTNYSLQIAKEIVSNSVIINTDTYMQPNRQYHVYVCVEYQGDASTMKKKIIDKIEQKIPDEDRIKMKYELQKFEQKIDEELAKMKAK